MTQSQWIFDSLIQNKSGLGTAGIVVINKQQTSSLAWQELQDFINMKAVVNVHLAEKDLAGCGEY